MTLAEALGITIWKPLVVQSSSQGAVTAPFLSHDSFSDVYCVGEELDECWNNESDDRWRLLLNIASALQISHDRLLLSEWGDAPTSANVWHFGGDLPLLGSMLADPIQKRHAWHHFMSSIHAS